MVGRGLMRNLGTKHPQLPILAATVENAEVAFWPISLTTASAMSRTIDKMMPYSATSCPLSSYQTLFTS